MLSLFHFIILEINQLKSSTSIVSDRTILFLSHLINKVNVLHNYCFNFFFHLKKNLFYNCEQTQTFHQIHIFSLISHTSFQQGRTIRFSCLNIDVGVIN